MASSQLHVGVPDAVPPSDASPWCLGYQSRLGPAPNVLIGTLALLAYALYFALRDLVAALKRARRRRSGGPPVIRHQPSSPDVQGVPRCLACWATSRNGGPGSRGLAVHSPHCRRHGVQQRSAERTPGQLSDACLADGGGACEDEDDVQRPLLADSDRQVTATAGVDRGDVIVVVSTEGLDDQRPSAPGGQAPSPSDPPSRVTGAALAGTLLCAMSHVICLVLWALLWAGVVDGWNPKTVAPAERRIPLVLVVAHGAGAVAWALCAVLLHIRRTHWDRTWVVAGYWTLAAALAVFDLYNHAMYWATPVPTCDAAYAVASGAAMLAAPQLARISAACVLAALVIRRFRRRSEWARAAADRRIHRLLGTDQQHSSAALGETPTRGPGASVPNLGTAPTAGASGAPLSGGTPRTRQAGIPSASEADIKFRPPSSMRDYLDKLRKLTPYVWPQGDRYLQCLVLLCGFLLLIGRLVNVLLPLQYKVLIDALTPPSVDDGKIPLPGGFPWGSILTFVFLRFLQAKVGLVSTAQDVLWIPVGQFTTRAISLRMFTHLHSLSHRFHLTRKTGEILRVQDRGVSSIMALLSTILFNIVPTLVDIVIAVAFFAAQFDVWFGLIVLVTMVLYIYATVRITERRTKHRRKSNLLENAMQAKAVDSLLNFETVKFYNAEQFEAAQYAKAMASYQKADWKSSFTSAILNITQNSIIQLGLLAGSLLCAHRVAIQRTMSVGDFVLFITFLTQLYGPLNDFGTYYKQVQKNFVDMEKMLDLMAMQPEVKDPPAATRNPGPMGPHQPPPSGGGSTIWNGPNAQAPTSPYGASFILGSGQPVVRQLASGHVKGHVVFDNVSFAYDPRMPTLRGISFEVLPGKTVALVGPSGSGKSTILRLLFRFYDVQGGRITIDGVDIRTIPQRELRALIAVVPQDCVLFNDTLRYNIRYGRVTASDGEVEQAARAAQIHERIVTFPDQYETRCGERGMRLSGGEKQRVAIARTLLKNPAITLLDEATSALDTSTERMIQNQLRTITKNRTTLIIAHRLSTVVHADTILVVRNGLIVERGSHDELMQLTDGVYRDMWQKQLRDNQEMLIASETDLSPLGNAGHSTFMESSCDLGSMGSGSGSGGALGLTPMVPGALGAGAGVAANITSPIDFPPFMPGSLYEGHTPPKLNLGESKCDLDLSLPQPVQEDDDDEDVALRHERTSTSATHPDPSSSEEDMNGEIDDECLEHHDIKVDGANQQLASFMGQESAPNPRKGSIL